MLCRTSSTALGTMSTLEYTTFGRTDILEGATEASDSTSAFSAPAHRHPHVVHGEKSLGLRRASRKFSAFVRLLTCS